MHACRLRHVISRMTRHHASLLAAHDSHQCLVLRPSSMRRQPLRAAPPPLRSLRRTPPHLRLRLRSCGLRWMPRHLQLLQTPRRPPMPWSSSCRSGSSSGKPRRPPCRHIAALHSIQLVKGPPLHVIKGIEARSLTESHACTPVAGSCTGSSTGGCLCSAGSAAGLGPGEG
jgi:hypothetical protein